MIESLFTCYASAERSSQNEIMRQFRVVADNRDMVVVLNGVASMLCVQNKNRQVVFVNKTLLEVLGLNIQQALGKRIGELFGCRHAFSVNGCGTSQHCSTCGVARSTLECVEKNTSIEECSLTNANAKVTFDLRAHSTYINVDGENFILCSLFDISSEKRRGVMERIFFHDIMNTVNGINGIKNALDKADANEQHMFISYLTLLLNSLSEQINSHRVLTMAEKDEYQTEKNELSSLAFVVEEVEKFRQQAEMEEKEIRIADHSEDQFFVSDKILLSRVLGNMIKNALEAEQAGAVIVVGVFKDVSDFLKIWVHNDSIMSENDKLQVFNRSFSTKGKNRGLGTYSMKLLTEKYLKGTICFESKENEGTVFTVRIPFMSHL